MREYHDARPRAAGDFETTTRSRGGADGRGPERDRPPAARGAWLGRRAGERAAGEPPAWARRAVQIVTFVLFVYLLFAGLQRLQPQPLANIFFRFDPLAALATMLAARAWLAPFALAFVTLGVTLVLGRVWCGWICPLGTLLGWLRFRSARRLAGRMPPALRRVKYVLLGADRRAGGARQPDAAGARPARAAHADDDDLASSPASSTSWTRSSEPA